MKSLLYKDLRLAIHPFYYILPVLTGALMLIPGWLYFIVLMYFGFISLPNMFASFKTQNDLTFSMMMPVRKKDIVKSRFISVLTLELLHIVIAIVYAVINKQIYNNFRYFFLEPNVAFFGLVFIMFGLLNIVFFPMFYKTSYNYGVPVIVANAVIIVFATAVELIALFNTGIKGYLRSAEHITVQFGILGGGIVFFVLFTIIAYRISIIRFEKVDI